MYGEGGTPPTHLKGLFCTALNWVLFVRLRVTALRGIFSTGFPRKGLEASQTVMNYSYYLSVYPSHHKTKYIKQNKMCYTGKIIIKSTHLVRSESAPLKNLTYNSHKPFSLKFPFQRQNRSHFQGCRGTCSRIKC